MKFKESVQALSVILPLALGLSTARAASDADAPTIAKDSVQVTPFTLNVFHKNFDEWSWVPSVAFRVNGPIASGSQLYAEFTLPGGGPWVKFDCRTSDTVKGRSLKTECGGHDVPEEKGSTYTGPVSFSIKMRNELASSDTTLFSGKFKVEKAHSNEHGPKVVNHFVYFANHDWNLPIGYVFLKPDEVRGWDLPTLHIAFWVRGEPSNFQPHLFLQDKEVAKKVFEGNEVGKAGCDTEVENTTTHYVEDGIPQKAKWARVVCTFPNLRAWDKTPPQAPGPLGPPYLMSANPGEYEFKVLWNNHLARSLKFRVGADGKFDNGIATANKLGSDRVIVPVQIVGDQDGTWDHTAWKAAFYGNPLTGFTPAP